MDAIPLRPVADPTADQETRRTASRSRPTRHLMTDRLKLEVADTILKTTGRLSGPQKRPVSGEQIGEALGLHPDSARLPLPFFKEAGFVEKSGRSEFTATDALIEFMRNESVGRNRADTIKPLTDAMSKSWYWEEVAPVLQLGAASKAEVISSLMRAAGASPHHHAMVENVVVWLQYVGLVKVEGDTVSLADDAPVEIPDPAADAEPAAPARTPVSKSTTVNQNDSRGQADFVLTLNLSLTREDLAALTPEQIMALSGVIQTIATFSTR